MGLFVNIKLTEIPNSPETLVENLEAGLLKCPDELVDYLLREGREGSFFPYSLRWVGADLESGVNYLEVYEQ